MAATTSLLIVLLVGTSSGHVISQNNKVQPYLVGLNIDLLTTKLHEKCPQMLEHDDFLGKRDLEQYDQAVEALDFANQVKIYHHIKELLKLCYQQLDYTPTQQNTTTAVNGSELLPPQCTSSSTVNLTESWRNKYPDRDLKNSDMDILKPGVTWFRFSGPAGNLLRNHCPLRYSCGSDSGAY